MMRVERVVGCGVEVMTSLVGDADPAGAVPSFYWKSEEEIVSLKVFQSEHRLR